MKVLIISDGHGNLESLEKLAPVAAEADAILYAGDFAALRHTETGRPFLERLAALHDRVFAVIGNCDEPEFLADLEEYDLSIEGSLSYFGGLMLSGSGGGTRFTGDTPNERSEEDLIDDLRLVAGSVPEGEPSGELWDNLVLVIHNPPKDTALDVIPGGIHVGSALVRSFIERYRPLLSVSGHIHESAAVDSLGPTTLVNPGPLAEGRYALAEITGGGKTPFAVSSLTLHCLE